MLFLHHKKFRLFLSFCFLLFIKTGAQSLSFNNINTSHGLSENNVRSIVIDKKGFLWIGTVDGLNVYDGYTVTSFKKENYPQLASNNIIHLTCDSRNRVWLGTYDGITYLDENRKFHRIVLNDSVTKFGCRTIMDTKRFGPVLYTSLGQFFFNEATKRWQKINWIPGDLEYHRFHDAEPFDENRIIYATDSLVMLVDYASEKITYQRPVKAVFSLCRYSDHELALGLQQGKVQVVDFKKDEIIKEYQLTGEINKKKVNSTITEVRPAANGNLLVSTDYAGLVIIDRNGSFLQNTHNPIQPNSIGANLIWRVLGGNNGDVVVGTNTAGISIANIYNRQAGYTRIFNDQQGNFYDSYISEMEEGRNDVLWIGALERLIRWNRKQNTARFFYYYAAPTWTGSQNVEIRTLCIDKSGRVWVSALGDGLAILDERSGQFKKIARDSTLGAAVKSDYIFGLYTSSDGTVWAGTGVGFYTIDPSSLKIKTYTQHPLLKKLFGFRVNSFLEDKKGNMWFATFKGVYYFNRQENRLDSFTEKQGLAADQCFTVFLDDKERLYAGTLKGLSVIADGRITTYNKSNGLKYDQCEGVIQDSQGKIWIANNKCIIRFDPDKGTMKYFDENAGLSSEGFRMGSVLKTRAGEMFWGGRAGVNYFFADQMTSRPADLKPLIYQAEIQDSVVNFYNNNQLSLTYDKNNVSFGFAAVNLKGSRNIQYQYKLEGFDKDWQTGVDLRQARYSSLPAGDYIFAVKASLDGKSWINAENKIALTIIPPLWQRWWFIGAFVALLIGAIYWIISNRNRKIEEQREELETEQAINYFASSLSEQQTEEEILWDVAKNCIGRLHFEDCVIYLWDEEKQVLVQTAAHGPKSPRQFEITGPIEIKPGEGIVGTVAKNGKAEIVNDTSADPRYIVDDEQRYSEISVPIVYNGRVLGVIDCEHSKKGFLLKSICRSSLLLRPCVPIRL